jgi:predicted permease
MLLYTLGLAGQATIPVSAVVSGLRMASMKPHHLWSLRMAAFAVVRLAVIPGIAILILHFIPLNTEVWRTLVVISTMPAAMACVPMAELYGGDREFAAAGVLISHIFCLVTIPFWLSVAGI